MILRDGRLLEAGPLSPSILSFGAFSTFGCAGGRPILWSAHVRRLTMTLSELAPGLEVMLPEEYEISEMLAELGLTGRIRGRLVAVLCDDNRWQIEVSAAPLEQCGSHMKPLRLRVIRWAAAGPLSGFKTLARLPWDLARRQAEYEGCDDALLIDQNSCILETSVANVFLQCGREVVTPIAPKNCLPGIMRQWLFENLGRLGFEVVERDVVLDDMRRADEVWTSNAIVGVRRVAEVDEINWTEWPVYERLRQLDVPAPGW